MQYLIHLAILVCIYLILAQSLNLTFGLGRLFNLAHIAVYAIGAYAAAILSTDYQWGFISCLIASVLSSGIFALLIGAISCRLEHDYFAIGSLAFAAVVQAMLINWRSLTRGVLGIPGIPRPELWELDFYDNTNFLLLILCFAVLSNIALYFLFRSPFAARLKAQAESPQAAMALGISIRRIRNQSFVISSMFAGLAGAFFSYYINYVDPSSFGLHEMIFVLSIVIVGKPGSFWGCLAACVFLVLLPEPLRFIDIPSSVLGPMRQMLHALILFLVVYWKRETLFPSARRV